MNKKKIEWNKKKWDEDRKVNLSQNNRQKTEVKKNKKKNHRPRTIYPEMW